MRCKRHTVDSSSSIGVCASCLRERLSSLAAASEDNNHHPPHRHSNISPPSVSASSSDSRFFSTPPQVLDSTTGGVGGSSSSSSSDKVFFETNRSSFKKKQSGLSRFFRTRSNDYYSRDSSDDASTFSPSSWFSKVLSKKQSTCYIEDLIAAESDRQQQRPKHNRYCRGMSPANGLESVEDSPGRARRTPTGTPGRRKTAATMALCLSPLVRAKPNNNCSSFGYNTGELKSPVKPHISTAASFSANRSKKLADLGRADHRR